MRENALTFLTELTRTFKNPKYNIRGRIILLHRLQFFLTPKRCFMFYFGDPAGAQSALRRRLPLHLRRRVQEGRAHLHGGQHPADAVLRHQHPHPLSVPQTLCQGECQSVSQSVSAL